MKKVLIALMLCLVSIMSLVSCNNNPLNKTLNQPLTVEEVASVNDTLFSMTYEDMKNDYDNLPMEFKVIYGKLKYGDILKYLNKMNTSMKNNTSIDEVRLTPEDELCLEFGIATTYNKIGATSQQIKDAIQQTKGAIKNISEE